MRRAWVILLALSFGTGCTSSYEPARSPRIATVVDGGTPTLVKDGVHSGSLAFGTGVVDAVRGNPRAEHHARIGRNLIVGGFVFTVAGVGTELGALAILLKDASSSEPSSSSPAGTALLIGGAAMLVTGSVMMLCGQPHMYDAINIYNDGLETAPAPTAAPFGPRVH